MRLVLLSSITGQNTRAVADRLATYLAGLDKVLLHPAFAADEQINTHGDVLWLKVETLLPTLAAQHPLLRHKRGGEPTLPQVLCLPATDLREYCHRAFEQSVQLATDIAVDLAILSLHPVLLHQKTGEFLGVYSARAVEGACDRHRTSIERIVSLHDDVYDMHLRLLSPGKLFYPPMVRQKKLKGDKKESRYYERLPQLDFDQQHLLLEWRAYELAEAKRLSSALTKPHFLVHQKVRSSTFWQVVGERRHSVYLSHPISQPRRDITGQADPEKCKIPDPNRGWDFIRRCNELADRLGSRLPLVEPTNIDELRIDYDQIQELTDHDLREHVLPTLSPRWPVTSVPRLSEVPTEQECNAPLSKVPVPHFEGGLFEYSGEHLGHLASSLRFLGQSIKRQIACRDYTLASQASLVVAFEPFSLPDSPAASGGVKDEIAEASNRSEMGLQLCSPAIIVLHPYSQEKARRRMVFDKRWDAEIEATFGGQDSPKLKEFRERARHIIINAPYAIDVDDTAADIAGLVLDLKITADPTEHDSSLGSDPLSRSDDAIEMFLDRITGRSEMLQSRLHRKPTNVVLFVDTETTSEEDVCSLIHEIWLQQPPQQLKLT